MKQFAISVTNLVKEFKVNKTLTTAVNGLSLQVARGDTYGLIGPDGAGKTTTMRVILGLLSRTSGESSVLGFDSMNDMYQIREHIGYIAQQFSLPPNLTVIENMLFFAGVHSVSAEDQKKRIPELLSFAGLTEFSSRLAGKLSGGMKKKLALACSLVHEPQVVMLDEPTLGVDPVSRREFWNLLGNLRAEKGLTIFICTPYMDEAERCTHVGLIYQGRMIVDDSPAQIKAIIPGHLLEFTPSDFAPALKLCAGMEGVLEVQTYGERLHVFVDDAARSKPQLEAALTAQRITYGDLREIEVRMEEAFISLIRRQKESTEQNGLPALKSEVSGDSR
ncbi:MAG TPA: ABC transporter ATP-binding protein [Anaerolineales bacterium]|nr:ABC transporter ATP-binding protein [Anaerolineales bacterium]